MVRLNSFHCFRSALNDIRINRALRQEMDTVQLACFFFKHTDKLRADNLALLLRLGNARQFIQEAVHRVHINEVGVHLVAEHLHTLLRFSFAQQTMVYMLAHQLLTDGLDEQRRHDRGIHAAGQCQKHFFISHLSADQLDLVCNEVLHVPVGLRTAGIEYKFGQDGFPLRRIRGPRRAAFVARLQKRQAAAIDIAARVDLHTVHHMVGAAVQNNPLYIGQRIQLRQCNIVGIDLTVHSQRANLPGKTRVFLAAQVQNHDHVLLHG